MKNRFFFTLIALLLVTSCWSQVIEDWRIHPNDAKYFIKGNFDNSTSYILTNVETGGITINNPKSIYYGEYQNDHDDVLFTFDHVETTCPTKFDYISYWVYDDEIKEWQPDVEIRSADRGMEHRKIMTVILVLDCSSSLENDFVHDFKYVKEGALTFLRTMYNASKAGNIRIGIIGFNSLKRTQIRRIEAINEGSYGDMVQFINNFDVANGTALYYSLDTAITMVENYVQSYKKTDKYTTPIVVTFTDGLDQTSFDNSKGIRSADSYYSVISNRLKENDIEHFVVPFKGSDISTEAQKDKFERVLRSLTKPNDNDHYLPVNSMSELGGIFGRIANNLVERWQILRCYVAPARQGKVCWTFGKKSKAAPPPPPPPHDDKPEKDFMRLPLLGLNVGIGGGFSRPTNFLDFSVGLDFAVAAKPKFAMGGFFSYKTTFQTIHQLSFGLDFMIGPQKRAFLLGLGCNTMFYRYFRFDVREYYYNYSLDHNEDYYLDYEIKRITESWDFDLRVGGIFKVFYFFADFSIGSYYISDDIILPGSSSIYRSLGGGSYVLPQMSLNIGINFMQMGKKTRNK